MKDRKKLHDLVFIMPVLYAILAYGMAKLVQNNGMYPSGMDALCHIYKGDALYDAVCQGDFFPIYDPLWYNGVELLRFWEPLPVYLMAICRFAGRMNICNSVTGGICQSFLYALRSSAYAALILQA